MSGGLAEVLAAHAYAAVRFRTDRRSNSRRYYLCTCEDEIAEERGIDDDHRAHVETAVLAWLAERLDGDDVREAVKWNLDHYGPRDAPPFQYSRFESPAHAALAAVKTAIGATP